MTRDRECPPGEGAAGRTGTNDQHPRGKGSGRSSGQLGDCGPTGWGVVLVQKASGRVAKGAGIPKEVVGVPVRVQLLSPQ